MGVDPQIKFSRARNGYDPKEVDDAFDEMQLEIDGLKKANSDLLLTVKRYNIKLQQLAESTRRLEREWAWESRRLADLISNATQAAEK